MPFQPPNAVGGAETVLGMYRAEDFGAHAGAADSSGGINLAAVVAAGAGGGLVVLDSGLVYNVRQTVQLPSNVELVIPTGTTLRGAPGLNGDVVAATGATGIRISGGGVIDANRAGGQLAGSGITLTGCTEPQLEELTVINAWQDGIALVNCVRPVVDVFAGANGRHGVYHSGTTFGRGQVSVRDNGQRVAGSGLVFDAASTDNAYAPVSATDTRVGGAKTQLYGMLEIAASGCDRNVIGAAALGGNATGTLSLVGASSGIPSGAPTGAAGGQLGGTYPAPTVAGPVASVALAAYPWHNADLSSDVARSNQLVNGGFEIWQRGNGPFTANFGPDRWALWAGTGNVGPISVVKDGNNSDTGSAGCCAVTITGAPSAAVPSQLYQYPFTVADGGQFRSRTLTLSVRVRCSVANACRLQLVSNPAGGATTYSGYHSGGGAYETLTVSITMPAAPAGVGLTVSVNFEAVGTFYVDNAMLVAGAAAADYVPLPPADDLARCLRYYEVLGEGGDIVLRGPAAGNGSVFCWTINYKARKAVSPTVTKNGTWGVGSSGQPSNAGSSVSMMSVQIVATAAGDCYVTNNPGPTCNFTVEANP